MHLKDSDTLRPGGGGAHSSGLLNWHWSSWEQRCNRSQLLLWEWELFPSPVGWSRVLGERLGTVSVERGSAPFRTAELDSNILNTRQWSGGESPRSVLFWGVSIYIQECCVIHRSFRHWNGVCGHLVTDSSKLLRLPTVIFTASVTLLSACYKSTHGAVTANRGRLCFLLCVCAFKE